MSNFRDEINRGRHACSETRDSFRQWPRGQNITVSPRMRSQERDVSHDGRSWRDPGHRKARNEFPSMRGEGTGRFSYQEREEGMAFSRDTRQKLVFIGKDEVSLEHSTEVGEDTEGERKDVVTVLGESDKYMKDENRKKLSSFRSSDISFRTLKSWSDTEGSEDLISQISDRIKSVEILLMKDTVEEEWYTLLVGVFTTVIGCQTNDIKLKELLHVISASHFLTHLLANYLDLKQEQGMMWEDAEEFFKSIVSIVQKIVEHLPERAQNCKPALKCLQGMVESIEPVCGNTTIQDLIIAALSVAKDTQMTWNENQISKTAHRLCSDSESPPEDFRQLSVIPTVLDLSTDAKPFVRAIITKGAYRDQEHYLDILFRLMREDFIKPLRSGIQEYREHTHDKKYRHSHINIYHSVHIIGMANDKGIHHIIQFDVSNMKRVKWDHSKRLLNGNLLCLSNDNFQSTLIFATVSVRDPIDLRRGIIYIECVSGFNLILKASSDIFVMAESSAYYEAVRPILKGLQSIDSDLPLKEYIISCQKQLKPPTYLLKEVRKYDISCIMKTPRSTEVSVLNPLSWPSSESMCLNPCQREAAILALTKEISIIQGPPGTGKTYVGLKVMQVLLENQDRMLGNKISKHDPILVICYTNHALDQFLEGILEFCPDGIVRVGGNRSSTCLERFNLVNLTRQKKESVWDSINSLYYEMSTYCHATENVKIKLDSLKTDVLSEHDLLNVMAEKHFDSLMMGIHKENQNSEIRQWLNAPNKSLIQALPEMIKHHMTNLVIKYLKLKKQTHRDLRLKAHQPIVERVQLYGYWLSEYRYSLQKELKEAERSGMAGDSNLLSLYRRSLRSVILDDSEICQVTQPKDIETIQFSLYKQNNIPGESDRMVESWLLGVHNECNKQLDDVEELTLFIKKICCHEDKDEDDFDDKEETEIAVNERQFFEDKGNKKEFHSLSSNIRTNGVYLFERAKSLGISENLEVVQQNGIADDAGFKTVTHKKPYTFSQMERFLADKSRPLMDDEEEDTIQDVWKLSIEKRFALYKLWISRCEEHLIKEMDTITGRYNDTKEKLTEIRIKGEIDVLRRAKVIGMTTTGAAKRKACLDAVGGRIIVVEEAAEVLEAHIVTALNKNCKHLILIGDHQQLRPNPTVYEHARHYGLDVSLFERLVNNGIPHVTLSEQHRMRESISVVMRHIYPNLQDHFSVKEYENIQGVPKNIFFIQHNHAETIAEDSHSRSNPFEAEYLVRLCKYFLLQGYQPSQITVLATYGGQVLALKKQMKKCNMVNVRVATVDNFQGEENDIILLSLVRSNEQNNTGFLKIDNRVCVALSRAKKGMFAIGNIALMASQSKLWKKIKTTAELEEITGEGLPISCPNHPDEKNVIRVPSDFDRSPEGGCLKKCDVRLECGHMCRLTCHGYDSRHIAVECVSPCIKSCPKGHACPRKCWQGCGPCIVQVQKQITACGHTNTFICSKDPEDTDCYSQCETVLSCGHRCTGKCGECKQNNAHKACEVPVTYTWPCDHAVEVPCHFKPTENPCPKPCDEILHCGHKCSGSCSGCLRGVDHVACREQCKKTLFCGHICQNVCSIPCPPCSLPCPIACRHGPCGHQNKKHACGESCTPCDEPCLNKCRHRKCTRKCHEKCDVTPCEARCFKRLNCGHDCSGLCGEMCVCSTCKRVSRIREFQNEETSCFRVQNLTKKLLLRIPSCWHVFILDEIDKYVLLTDKKTSSYFINCPQCSNPINKCHRYDRVLKGRHLTREGKKKKLKYRRTCSNSLTIRTSFLLVLETDPHSIWFDWRNLEDYDVESTGEFLAVTSKLKFAYVINAIMSLKQDDSASCRDEELQERVSALLKVEKLMSYQQIEEYTVDLKRCLILRYSGILKRLFSNCREVVLSQDATKTWIDTIEELKRSRPTTDAIEGGLSVVSVLENAIENECSDSTVQNSLLSKKIIVERAMEVLNADNKKSLNDILAHEFPAQTCPLENPRSVECSSTRVLRKWGIKVIYEIENTESKEVKSEDIDSKDVKSEDIDSEGVKSEDIDSKDAKSEDIDSKDAKSEDIDSKDAKSEDIDSKGVKSEDIDSKGVKSEDIDSKGVKSEDIDSKGVKNSKDVKSEDIDCKGILSNDIDCKDFPDKKKPVKA